MMSDLKRLKKIYDRLENDSIRSKALAFAELLGIRKDILRMDTNNYCNIKCIMCNRVSTGNEKHFMALADFKKAIDLFAPTLRNLYLSCACEPFATPHFTEYVKYAKSKGIPFVSFCTNALAMNREMTEQIVDMGVDEVIISFNGFTKDDYQRIMYGSDYTQARRNISALTAYKRKKGVSKPNIRLNTVLLNTNLTHMDKLIDFVMENGIDTVQFRELQLFDGQNNPEEVKRELLSNLSPDEQKKLIDKANKAAEIFRAAGKEVILPLSFHHLTTQRDNEFAYKGNEAEKSESAKSKPKILKLSCAIPYFSYWMDWAGEVRICGYDEKGIIGNIFKDRFPVLKTRRKYFRKLALKGQCRREACTVNIDVSEIS
jgi:MoaA/NifB/PqqE/SkfB family radical SAM enzyme